MATSNLKIQLELKNVTITNIVNQTPIQKKKKHRIEKCIEPLKHTQKQTIF